MTRSCVLLRTSFTRLVERLQISVQVVLLQTVALEHDAQTRHFRLALLQLRAQVANGVGLGLVGVLERVEECAAAVVGVDVT